MHNPSLLTQFLIDPKVAEARASLRYLFQQITEEYDKKSEKVKINTASHTGFCEGLFIVDQYNQINLQNMEWLSSENLGEFASKLYL